MVVDLRHCLCPYALGLLPHLGNKLWALKDQSQRFQFVKLAALFGVTLGMLGLGGLLAGSISEMRCTPKGVTRTNHYPSFSLIFPTWLAALIGVGVLSAVMSTADGLAFLQARLLRMTFIVALSHRNFMHTFRGSPRSSGAHDLSLFHRRRPPDHHGYGLGLRDINVALIVWIGVGGMMAALSGPLIIGALWQGLLEQVLTLDSSEASPRLSSCMPN